MDWINVALGSNQCEEYIGCETALNVTGALSLTQLFLGLCSRQEPFMDLF
jgi:hypothetical protein